MKRLKQIATAIILSTAMVGTPLLAADAAEERARTVTEMMEDELNLSDEQAEKVFALNKQMFSDLSALRDQGSANRMAQVRGFRALGKEREEALKTILTEEQFNEWQANADERKQELRAMMRERRQQ